ncbi:MAG TPA: dihydroneopterin aldolase [Chloroflexi bacterium]|nr:dihydroneopterin aldolase [Chloroflexota bacterium]|tara:strand:+ start:490 stop:858 length:369 start_codon:yes stop_codon:yes gene_type:complete
MLKYDRIKITDLHLRAIIGINPDERKNLQDVLINVVLYVDSRPAAASDDISDSANYRTITKEIIKLVESSKFYLIEKLASEIATICLKSQQVETVSVNVQKPTALRFAKSVGITIERGKTQS